MGMIIKIMINEVFHQKKLPEFVLVFFCVCFFSVFFTLKVFLNYDYP